MSMCSTAKHTARSADELTQSRSLLSDSHPDAQSDAPTATSTQAATSLSDHASSTSRQTDSPSSFFLCLARPALSTTQCTYTHAHTHTRTHTRLARLKSSKSARLLQQQQQLSCESKHFSFSMKARL